MGVYGCIWAAALGRGRPLSQHRLPTPRLFLMGGRAGPSEDRLISLDLQPVQAPCLDLHAAGTESLRPR